MLTQRNKQSGANTTREKTKDHQIKKINQYMFDVIDEIGRGYSSIVYKGYDTASGKTVAIKTIQLKKISNEVQKKLLNNQIKALKSLQHPNVLKAIDVLQTSNNFYVVTEFYECSLEQLINSKKKFTESECLQFMEKMAEVLCYLEQKNIVHRDIKPSNIFVKGRNYILGDFGFCGFRQGSVNSSKKVHYNVGSPMYMSPESYMQSVYSIKSDTWSLGICLLQMILRQKIFAKIPYDQMITTLQSKSFISDLHATQIIKKLLRKILTTNIQNRAYPSDILRELSNRSQKYLLGLESNKVLAEDLTKILQEEANKSDRVIGFKGRKHIRKVSMHDHTKPNIGHHRKLSQKQNFTRQSIQKINNPRYSSSQQKGMISPRSFHSPPSNNPKFVNPADLRTTTISMANRSPYLDNIYHPLAPILYVLVSDSHKNIKQSLHKLKLTKLLLCLCPPIPRAPSFCSDLMKYPITNDPYCQYLLSNVSKIPMDQYDHYLLFLIRMCLKEYAQDFRNYKYTNTQANHIIRALYDYYSDNRQKQQFMKNNNGKPPNADDYYRCDGQQIIPLEQLLKLADNALQG